MRDRIEQLVDNVLRPLVEADGGTLELVSVEGNVVVLRLGGACAGCPGAPYTTAHVLEPAVLRVAGGQTIVKVERAARVA